MDFFRQGLQQSFTGFGWNINLQDNDALSLVSNFASGALLGPGLDQISRSFLPNSRRYPPAPPKQYPTKQYGERGSGTRSSYGVQDFRKIRDQCLQKGVLFEDQSFPADDFSLFFFGKNPGRKYQWLRPHQIAKNPELFVDGASRFDIRQGELGDCWLLAAMANLTLSKNMLHQVVPEDQSFTDKYAGIFHFRFWQYGRWIDIVVDDRLPTHNGKLVYLQSRDTNEFWSALLEKAYAKLHGCYEALKGGTTCEAMEDFTGGVSEVYELTKAPPNLFSIMLKAFERNSLMSCAIEPDPKVLEAQTPLGLVKGHAYSITSVRFMDIKTPRVSGKIPLVRLRNPWGNETEWKGAWSDKSAEWQYISEADRRAAGLTFDHDGEFWMSFRDFSAQFSRLEIVNLNPDSLEEEILTKSSKKRWETSLFEGAWVKNATAGGCRNFLETFALNPQYRITLEDPDDDDNDDLCTIIIALMQKNRRMQRQSGAECLTIGYSVYHLKHPDSAPKPLDTNFFKHHASVARSPTFVNMREVSCRFKLPPGTYAIIPSTYEPHHEGEFILRTFSEKRNNMQENDEEVGLTEATDKVKPEENKAQDEAVQVFTRAAGADQEIDWSELQVVLNTSFTKEFSFDGFSKDVCRSMVAMLDTDHSGKLGVEEFRKLWTDIQTWKNTFKMYDHDRSGTLSTLELRTALHDAGYRLNHRVLSALVLRYGNRDGVLSFDDFIMCAIKLKIMIETFTAKDPYNTKRASFTLDEWIEKTLYS